MDPAAWLARVRHDLVKRLAWPARDRQELGGAPVPGELAVALVDDEGRPATPAALWLALCAEAPPSAALDDFAAALGRAVAAAAADDVDGVLTIEAAFEALARSLEPPERRER